MKYTSTSNFTPCVFLFLALLSFEILICMPTLTSGRPLPAEQPSPPASSVPDPDDRNPSRPDVKATSKSPSTQMPGHLPERNSPDVSTDSTTPSLFQVLSNKTPSPRQQSAIYDFGQLNSPMKSTTIKSETLASAETDDINFLTLIAVIAIVVTVFITCILIATVCPRRVCYFFRPLFYRGYLYQNQQLPSQAPVSPVTPQPPPLRRLHQQRIGRISDKHIRANLDESQSSEAISSHTNDFCCFGFQGRKIGCRHSDSENPSGDASGGTFKLTIPCDNSVVQKYRKLTHYSSDSEERSSSERGSTVIESDSDNLSNKLYPRSRTRALPQVYRGRRKSEGDVIAEKDINMDLDIDYPATRFENQIQRQITARSRSLPQFFISQCPYCSCNNLMVHHNFPKGNVSTQTLSQIKHSAM